MIREYFTLKNEFAEVFDMLTVEQAGELIKMVFRYVASGKHAKSEDTSVEVSFTFMRQYLDYMSENFDAKRNTSAENGKKGAEYGKLGGRPRRNAAPRTVNAPAGETMPAARAAERGTAKAESMECTAAEVSNVASPRDEAAYSAVQEETAARDNQKPLPRYAKTPKTPIGIGRVLEKEKEKIIQPQSRADARGGEKTSSKAAQWRKSLFFISVEHYMKTYGQKMLDVFFDYWGEMNAEGTKMRFEYCQDWNTEKRLALWATDREKEEKGGNDGEFITTADKERAERERNTADIVRRIKAQECGNNSFLR